MHDYYQAFSPVLNNHRPGYRLPYRHAHRRIATEPSWKPVERFTSLNLPPADRAWLLDDGSLTGRLIELDQGLFSVRRLFQGWQVPLPSERRLLDIPCRQQALIREVVLALDDCPVVFARSVIPYSSLTGELAHLRRLQNRPLGAILFGNAGMHRSPFELAMMQGQEDYLPVSLRQQPPLWGRRSCFDVRGKQLMVSEVFLQEFSPWPAVLPVHRTQRGKVTAAIIGAKQ